MPRTRRPDPEPLELDNPRIVAVLTLAWVVAAVVLAAGALLGAGVHGWWIAMCLCGAVLGVLGLRFMARRRASARRRAHTGSRSSSPGSD